MGVPLIGPIKLVQSVTSINKLIFVTSHDGVRRCIGGKCEFKSQCQVLSADKLNISHQTTEATRLTCNSPLLLT